MYEISPQKKERAFTGKIFHSNLKKITGRNLNKAHKNTIAIKNSLELGTYHRNTTVANMLLECASQLKLVSKKVEDEGFIPIFTPLHFCSDRIAVVIAAMTSPKEMIAYSIYGKGSWGLNEKQNQRQYAINIKEYRPNGPAHEQRIMLKEVKSGSKGMVIFPDILPQCTQSKMLKNMSYAEVNLFNRSAIMHNGYERIAKITNGKFINYYIYWYKNCLKINIFEPTFESQDVIKNIEISINTHAEQWLLWHYPSFFYYNIGK